MDGINKVIIVGNLGADPDLRLTPGGQHMLKLRVATNETYFDKEEKKQQRTEWHRVTVWGRRAEGLSKFLRKGATLVVEGRLHTSSYEKEGQKHYSTEIVATEVVVTGSGRATEKDPMPMQLPGNGNGNGAFARTGPAPMVDIPF